MTISKYLTYIGEIEALQLKDMGGIRRDFTVPNSVIITWQISFDQIKKTDPQAAELLSLMSVLDRQGIPEFLFCKEGNRLDFDDALAPLNHFSLITSEIGGKSFGMDRLVQLAMRTWLKTHGEIEKWEGEAVRLLSESFPIGEYENWGICRALLPHAEAVLAYPCSNPNQSLQQAEVLYNTASYFKMQGNYDLALNRSQQALSIHRQFLTEENNMVLCSMNLIALVLDDQGKSLEAEKMHQQVLKLHQKTLGVEHPDTLRSINNLTSTLNDQGKSKAAEEIYQ